MIELVDVRGFHGMSSRWTYGDKEDGFLAIPVAQGIIKTSPGSVSTSSETSEDDISPRSFSRERVAVVERVDSTIPPFVAAVETFVIRFSNSSFYAQWGRYIRQNPIH